MIASSKKRGSMSDVAQFLDELGLSQYCRAFLDNAVDYALLPELSDTDLRELGVEVLVARHRGFDCLV